MTDAMKALVVDATTGLLGWRVFPQSGGAGCTWELVNGNSVTAVQPNGANGTCPENDNKVGIGTAYPTAKLHVILIPPDPGSYTGTEVFVQAHGTSSDLNTGIVGGIVGSGHDVRGLYGYAFSDGYPTVKLIGGEGAVYDITGDAEMAVGLLADARSASATNTVYGMKSYIVGGNALSRAGYFQGDLEYTGALIGPSDRKLKHDISDLTGAMDILKQLEPKRFTFRTDQYKGMNLPAGTQMGLIAQDVEAVLPQLVHESQLAAISDRDGKELSPAVKYKGVDYVSLIPLLIAGLNEQQATIERLQEQIDALNAGGKLSQQGTDGTSALHDLRTERLAIAPNPFTTRATVRYLLTQDGTARLELSNEKGQLIGVLDQVRAAKGEYTYDWNTRDLAAGTYFLALVVDGDVVVKRAVKVE
jgi:hypothetical protein